MQERRALPDAAGAGPRSRAVIADGLIFTSSLAGVDDETGKVAGPDVQSQTRRALDRLKAVLASAGSSLGQAVSMFVQLKTADDFDAMNAAYREYFPESPPTRTTIVSSMTGETVVEISAIAVPDGAPRETMLPAGWMKSPRPYSYIVRAGGLVFLSGLVSRRGTDDQFVSGWVRTQVKTILDNAGVLLKTAGLSYSDVVSARVYLTDDQLFEEMNDEYRKYFPTAPPARATAIAGLMGADTLAEITIIASQTPKEIVGPDVSSSLPISTAVRAGRRVFLSGVLGNTDANAGQVPGQTREVLDRIQKTLELGGMSFADVVDSTVYLPQPYRRDEMDDIYKDKFAIEPPARTIVGAKLVQRAGVVELMLTAVK